MLPPLLDQIPKGQIIESSLPLSANADIRLPVDGRRLRHTRLSRRHRRARSAGRHPAAQDGKPWKENMPGAHVSNEALRASRRFGRAIWRRWSGYHRRSRMETKMRCFKALGERIVSRDFERQVAELHIRVAAPNCLTALGTPVTKRVP